MHNTSNLEAASLQQQKTTLTVACRPRKGNSLHFTLALQNCTTEDWEKHRLVWAVISADIQTLEWWFGVNTMDPSCLVSVAQAGSCDSLADIFLVHFQPLISTEHRSFLYHHSLPVFWWHCRKNPPKLVSEPDVQSREIILSTQMASTVTRSQFNKAPFGCSGMGDHGCAAKKNCSNYEMLSCPYGLCFEHLVESVPPRILKGKKRSPTRYKKGVPNEVAGEFL